MQNARPRALISVTNKEGIAAFAKRLVDEFDFEIISTGGTARALIDAGVDVIAIDEVTGFPEMLDGRVKTLHPHVHGGLLARRDLESHMEQVRQAGIELIDMVVVNLYEFTQTIADPHVTLECAIEHIDIGGPSMLRSAAKNYRDVTVVVDPADYEAVLEALRAQRAGDDAVLLSLRRRLGAKVFATTAAYDTAIAAYLAEQLGDGIAHAQDASDEEFPEKLTLTLERQQMLRYGENPHQGAAFYRFTNALPHALVNAQQLQGKELSYNNLLDADACWAAVRDFTEPAVVIMKHQNPCGAADGKTIDEAYDRAFACDPISAFGGIIACNREVNEAFAQKIADNKHFVEVIIAPSVSPQAQELFAKRANLRVLVTGDASPTLRELEMRSVEGGMLVQHRDVITEHADTFKTVTTVQPTPEQMEQLEFAWSVVKNVKSNAIVVARDHKNIGMGAGQPNRVQSARIALAQAGDASHGAVVASDAFFPFRDSIDELAAAGIAAIVQPGGSIRDEEVIQACNEHGITMVFTGKRHFRH